MKKSTFMVMAAVLTAVMLTAFKCGNGNEPVNESLQGTKWKLEGIVNEQTGEMQVLEPTDCEQCYTFEFDTDATAAGKASPNVLLVNLSNTPLLNIATYINNVGDEAYFSEVIQLVTRYEYDSENAKLKFFYQQEENNCFLLFKKLQ
jgi:hypothetical protein